MSTRYPPREADDDILTMLHMRCAGLSTSAVASALGVAQQTVSFHTANVLKADLAESAEPVGAVRKAYWA